MGKIVRVTGAEHKHSKLAPLETKTGCKEVIITGSHNNLLKQR